MEVLAAVAHPDDIEFMTAGTLLRLKEAGCNIHFWNLANGYCGTQAHSREEIIKIRRKEAAEAAALAGATIHEALFDDLGVFYDAPSLARVSAVVREVAPDIVITHAPTDYMEDHQNVCRLVVMAAFGRGMTNYVSEPPRPVFNKSVRVYHAMPHGLRNGLGQLLSPDCYVDIGEMIPKKKELLACHRSQKDWLDASQGMGAYLEEMERLCAEMGRMSGRFPFAEGFLRHNHLGFCPADFDPLAEILGGHCIPASH